MPNRKVITKVSKPEPIGYDCYGDPIYGDYDFAEEFAAITKEARTDSDKLIIYSSNQLRMLPDQSASEATVTFKMNAEDEQQLQRVLKPNGSYAIDPSKAPKFTGKGYGVKGASRSHNPYFRHLRGQEYRQKKLAEQNRGKQK